MLKIMTALIALPLFAMMTASGADISFPKENLVDPDYFRPNVSYYNAKTLWEPYRGQKFDIQDNMLVMKALAGGKNNSAKMDILAEYSTAEAYQISFYYRGSGNCEFSMNFSNLEKRLDSAYFNVKLPPSADWKLFTVTVPGHPEAMGSSAIFDCSGEGGSLYVKDMTAKAVEPAKIDGKALMLGKQECEAIYFVESDQAGTYFDLKAARMLRYAIARNGGKLIPVREIKAPSDYDKPAVFIGKAAEKSGVINTDSLAAIAEGGYAMRLAGNRLAIAGAHPSGTAYGVFAFLKKIGIEYLSADQSTKPAGAEMAVADFTDSCNPAIPLRELNFRVIHAELLGYTAHENLANYRKTNSHVGNCHSAPELVSLKEFEESHPEYFALRSNGERLRSINGKKVEIHYCMTNTGLHKLMADRLMEVMKSDPYARYFYLFPGDGGDYACTCASCVKLGNPTDRLLYLINKVAEQTIRKFPDRMIMTLAYSDSCPPPTREKPASNVLVLYTPYTTATWGNHFQFRHEANETGQADMSAWEKLCPKQLGAFTYPSSCSEKENIWPAFYANCDFARHFAERKYRALVYTCGIIPIYGGGSIPQTNSFCDLFIKVLGKIICNPKLNVEAAVDDFMKQYYGPAAPAMRKYFNLISAEPGKRNWSQNIEVKLRGFVTQKLADEAFKYLDEAEKAAEVNSVFRKNVLKEKKPMLWHYLTDVCRTNGKVNRDNFKSYAARLGQYAKVSEELGQSYMDNPDAKRWFMDCTMLKIGDQDPWYNDPLIKELIANPGKTLGESIPNCQEKKDYGYLIPNAGVWGGETSITNWMRTDRVQVKVLRRPSSGFGTGQFLLRLNQIPSKPVVMSVAGLDNEKKAPAMIDVIVNGQSIYKGAVPWEKNKWTEKNFTIPAAAFKSGDNDIIFMNVTPDTEVDGVGGRNFAAQRNYTWGWFMVQEVKVYIK